MVTMINNRDRATLDDSSSSNVLVALQQDIVELKSSFTKLLDKLMKEKSQLQRELELKSRAVEWQNERILQLEAQLGKSQISTNQLEATQEHVRSLKLLMETSDSNGHFSCSDHNVSPPKTNLQTLSQCDGKLPLYNLIDFDATNIDLVNNQGEKSRDVSPIFNDADAHSFLTWEASNKPENEGEGDSTQYPISHNRTISPKLRVQISHKKKTAPSQSLLTGAIPTLPYHRHQAEDLNKNTSILAVDMIDSKKSVTSSRDHITENLSNKKRFFSSISNQLDPPGPVFASQEMLIASPNRTEESVTKNPYNLQCESDYCETSSPSFPKKTNLRCEFGERKSDGKVFTLDMAKCSPIRSSDIPLPFKLMNETKIISVTNSSFGKEKSNMQTNEDSFQNQAMDKSQYGVTCSRHFVETAKNIGGKKPAVVQYNEMHSIGGTNSFEEMNKMSQSNDQGPQNRDAQSTVSLGSQPLATIRTPKTMHEHERKIGEKPLKQGIEEKARDKSLSSLCSEPKHMNVSDNHEVIIQTLQVPNLMQNECRLEYDAEQLKLGRQKGHKPKCPNQSIRVQNSAKLQSIDSVNDSPDSNQPDTTNPPDSFTQDSQLINQSNDALDKVEHRKRSTRNTKPVYVMRIRSNKRDGKSSTLVHNSQSESGPTNKESRAVDSITNSTVILNDSINEKESNSNDCPKQDSLNAQHLLYKSLNERTALESTVDSNKAEETTKNLKSHSQENPSSVLKKVNSVSEVNLRSKDLCHFETILDRKITNGKNGCYHEEDEPLPAAKITMTRSIAQGSRSADTVSTASVPCLEKPKTKVEISKGDNHTLSKRRMLRSNTPETVDKNAVENMVNVLNIASDTLNFTRKLRGRKAQGAKDLSQPLDEGKSHSTSADYVVTPMIGISSVGKLSNKGKRRSAASNTKNCDIENDSVESYSDSITAKLPIPSPFKSLIPSHILFSLSTPTFHASTSNSSKDTDMSKNAYPVQDKNSNDPRRKHSVPSTQEKYKVIDEGACHTSTSSSSKETDMSKNPCPVQDKNSNDLHRKHSVPSTQEKSKVIGEGGGMETYTNPEGKHLKTTSISGFPKLDDSKKIPIKHKNDSRHFFASRRRSLRKSRVNDSEGGRIWNV